MRASLGASSLKPLVPNRDISESQEAPWNPPPITFEDVSPFEVSWKRQSFLLFALSVVAWVLYRNAWTGTIGDLSGVAVVAFLVGLTIHALATIDKYQNWDIESEPSFRSRIRSRISLPWKLRRCFAHSSQDSAKPTPSATQQARVQQAGTSDAASP